jgi:hypothetical protein
MTFVRPLIAAVLCSTTVFAQQAEQNSQPENHGKVLFSRSVNEAQNDPAPEKMPTVHAQATDAERSSITFIRYDLDVHLMLKQQAIAAQARVAVRNDGNGPLTHLPLQLSSSLRFETITLNGKKLAFAQNLINSDADHTGQLREAVVDLPQPLSPKSELTLDIGYSGEITPSAKRLEQIGTPADIAQQSDWDQISEDFTGLRGFGDVVWYPVASVPHLLSNGPQLFSEIGRQKFRQQDARVAVRVTAEYIGAAPNAAAINGHSIPVPAPKVTPTASFPGVVTFSLPEQRLGFGTLNLFLGPRTIHESNGTRILASADDEPNVQAYQTAATMVQSLVEQWLGQAKGPLTIFDLPAREDASFEQGTVTATGLKALDPQKLTGVVCHGLAHAAFQSPREWLNEGVANFLVTLWIEQSKGRDAALEYMESSRGALAIGEPSSPGESAGEPLIAASDAIYYRTKATYVLWMLRDLAGDKALSAALRSYDPGQDTTPEYFEHLVEQASGKDLKWFFDDWVYHDKGLPDLSIAAVYPSAASQAGQYLVAIDLANDGYASAEVPVTVHTRKGTQTERVQIPARSKVTRRILITGLPTEVVLNDGVVPEVQASIHKHEITITNGEN